MAVANWEEIKRLAADFQRAQLSTTTFRLPERNCVEIVQRLIELKLIEVIYTTDGKQYLTPLELTKEIREELQVHGGRINLVDLQQILNVDFTHIEAKANEIVKSDKHLNLVLGQLIDEHYLDTIAEEINDRLQEQGQITYADITKTYDLPRDFIIDAVNTRLGKTIIGQRDEVDKEIIFTQAFVDRHTAKIRGAFSAVTRPVSLSTMAVKFQLQERLLSSILEDLIKAGCLAGSVTGGRLEKSEYLPDVYTQSQNEWVDNFYAQNGYLEYDALTRLGIGDPKAFIKKRLKSVPGLLYLSTCCVGKPIQDQLEAQVDEGLASVGWIDVLPLLPSICSVSDSQQLLQRVLKSRPHANVFCDCIVASKDFVESCVQPFQNIMNNKAEKDVKMNPTLLSKSISKGDKSEDKRESDKKESKKSKSSGGKSGGGTQGREVKTKVTKKKYLKGKGHQADDDSDDDLHSGGGGGLSSSASAGEVDFLKPEEIEDHLKAFDKMQECPEELVREIALHLYRPLRKQYQEAVKSVFLQSVGNLTTSSRKKTHGDMSEKMSGLWTNAKLFEKSLKFFPDDVQVHLVKHLLRTVCTDITNLVFNTAAADHMMSVTDETTLSQEARTKILAKIPEGKQKVILAKLNSSLSGKSIEEFFSALDSACGSGMVEVLLKKPDKKKERQLVFNHKQSIAEQMKEESDPAMTLHLAATLLFNVFTQCMVHAPGRCVPSIIAFLKPHMEPDSHQTLVTCQDLVVQQLTHKTEDDSGTPDTTSDEASQLSAQLRELLPKIKDIALNTRKTNKSDAAVNED